MTPRALKSSLLFVVVVCCVACGGSDPDARTSDWEENFDKARHASSSGDHQQAISVAEAYLKRHPDNVDGHQMVGNALMEAAQAASDASRTTRFEESAKHYQRALELTHNKMWRLMSLSALVRIYDTQGLNKPQDAMKYARMLSSDEPNNVNAYSALLHLQGKAKQFADAAALLSEAKAKMEPTEDNAMTYGGMVHDLVATTEGFPPDMGRRLLPEGVTVVDEALKKYGRTEKLLRTKGALLRAQADIETDPAKEKQLREESGRVFDEMERLAK